MEALKRSFLARSVHDAAWRQLRDLLGYRAESAGRSMVLVDPRGTSRRCSGCGAEPDRPKTLGERVHGCDGCGLVLDREVNAIRNVPQLVQGPGTGREACGLPRSLARSRGLQATACSRVHGTRLEARLVNSAPARFWIKHVARLVQPADPCPRPHPCWPRSALRRSDDLRRVLGRGGCRAHGLPPHAGLDSGRAA